MVIRLGNPPCPRLALELLLDPVPGLQVDDRRMKAVVDLPFMAQPSDIDRVRQDPVEVAPGHQVAAAPFAGPARADRRAKVLGVEDGLEAHHDRRYIVALPLSPRFLFVAANARESIQTLASADAAAGAQDAAVQEPGVSPEISFHTRRRLQHLVQRHLVSAQTHRVLRTDAMATWRTALAAA